MRLYERVEPDDLEDPFERAVVERLDEIVDLLKRAPAGGTPLPDFPGPPPWAPLIPICGPPLPLDNPVRYDPPFPLVPIVC